MNKVLSCMLGLLIAMPVFAGEAKVLKVEQTVEVAANHGAVWDKISNFGDLGAWHPAVAKTEITSGENNKVGAVRVLTLQDGGKITEKLLKVNAKKMTFKYAIVEGVLPVSDYTSSITVKPISDSKTLVTWQGSFKRKDQGENPAANANDETAIKTMTSVYRGGLDNLKKIME